MKNFVPFHELDGRQAIVVDGLHPQLYTLSHWKGTNTIPSVAADTSGEIVLNAIRQNKKNLSCELVTATHFDIDGFVGVFALFHQDLAMQYNAVLSAMARIGDFRELRENSEDDEHALKLCCWMNTVEKKKFYRPFEEKNELALCVQKFEYFLPVFPEVLKRVNDFEKDWMDEYNKVKNGLQLIQAGSKNKYPDICLIVKKVTQPIHYYALFSGTEGYDMILTTYDNNCYELEYKYTTWVDIASRPTYPRINLQPLVALLNTKETSGYQWQADAVTDTGPILRLESAELSKADRYANPYERKIFSSSIHEDEFIKLVVSFFETNLKSIEPKKFWSWKETKMINNTLFKS